MTQNNEIFSIKKKNSHSFFLSVEGNIGAGKSTFLKKLSENLYCPLLLEPCHEWQDINGYNLLDEFYKDTKRWAYSFQLYAFLTRIESIEKKIDIMDNDFFISERSIFADRYVFAEACHKNGNMSELEWNMYTKWFDWMIFRKHKRIMPSGIIYLLVDPEISYDRINIRGRLEEKNISKKYLQNLYEYHNKWLLEKKDIHELIKDIPVLVINCNDDFEKNINLWENMLSLVKNFVYTNFKKSILDKGMNYGLNTSSFNGCE